jgi:hypothetical protein
MGIDQITADTGVPWLWSWQACTSHSLNEGELCIRAILFVLTLIYMLGQPDYTCSYRDWRFGAWVVYHNWREGVQAQREQPRTKGLPTCATCAVLTAFPSGRQHTCACVAEAVKLAHELQA